MIASCLRVLLYVVDVGLDINVTIDHLNNCYYTWFELSCIHLSMPFIGFAINLLLADLKRWFMKVHTLITLHFLQFRCDEPIFRMVVSFPCRVLLLPVITIKDLWHGDVKQYKVYEVFFEAFPQFLFQLYIICDHGFSPWPHVWSNVIKVLSLLTSYISLAFGINKYVVCRKDRFATKKLTMVGKCYIYTFCDLHFRLGFYLLNCTLMKLNYLIIYAFQSFVAVIVCVFCKKSFEKLSFLYIFSVNILPQSVIDKSMKVSMMLKIIYNICDGFIVFYYSLLLYFYDHNTDLFGSLNIFNLSLGRIPTSSVATLRPSMSVCHLYQNSSLSGEEIMAEINQIPTQISKEDILSIQIPLIMVLIIISSLEIIIFHFCHGTWKKLILDAEDKIDLNVRFFKHIL